MPRFCLSLLGNVQATLDGTPITSFRSVKSRALLAWLALESGGRAVPRSTLLALFWPGYTRRSAQQSLRSTLHNLRQVMAPLSLLESTRDNVRLRVEEANFWCDVLHLQQQTERWTQKNDSSFTRLDEIGQAIAQGDEVLLTDINLVDCPGFQSWLQRQRTQQDRRMARLRQLHREVARTSRHNLPRPVTPFYGRRAEIEHLRRKVLDADYPLITLTGPGGVGKSRLALAVGDLVQQDFADGVWFVALADVVVQDGSSDEFVGELIAGAIGAALPMHFYSGASLVGQLTRWLQTRDILLILDNFEHLVRGAKVILSLLRQTSAHLLVTSRVYLGFQAEYIQQVKGLPVPHREAAAAPDLEQHSSIQLFVERAGRSRLGFQLTAQNRAAVLSICRAVDGSPLAIELAAAMAQERSCRQIAAAIQHGSAALATQMADLPPRHRTLQAVFDSSWQLLPPEARQALTRCTVFHGDFSTQAARVVAGVSLAMLRLLVRHSLLDQPGADCYRMHSLARHFAANHWPSAAEHRRTQESHKSLLSGLSLHDVYGISARRPPETIV